MTPLVVSETPEGDVRLAGIGTIDKSGYRLESLVPYPFLLTRPVLERDGLLTVGDGHYVTIRPILQVTLSYAEPIVPGFHVQAVGDDATGRLWAVESRATGTWHYENELVDLETHEHVRVPSGGFVQGFLRGADGKAYFKVLDVGPGEGLFRAQSGGAEALKGTGHLTSDDDVAIAADGTVWRASILGVRHIDGSGKVIEGIGPIAPVPCSIGSTAALTTRSPRVAPDGAIWFAYRALFRVDRGRSVVKFQLPDGLTYTSDLTFGRDGSVWFVGDQDGTPSVVRLSLSP